VSSSSPEKRQFHRLFYEADAIVSIDELTLPCRVIDISLKGCLLEFEQPWKGLEGGLCLLVLNLSSEVAIRMQLSHTHSAGTQVGFKCEHIDIDSITNLRRLVELNLGDSALLERELGALCV